MSAGGRPTEFVMFRIELEPIVQAVIRGGNTAEIETAGKACANLVFALEAYCDDQTVRTKQDVIDGIAGVSIMMHRLAVMFSFSDVYRSVNRQMDDLKKMLERTETNDMKGHDDERSDTEELHV